MNSATLRAWLVLRAVRGIGDATVCQLVRAFGSPEAVRAATREALMSVGGVGGLLAERIQRGPDRETQQAIERELGALERLRLSVVTVQDAAYPARLKAIYDPPPLLYVSGSLTETDGYAVAIVGSRRATPAGRALTEQLSRDLASAGFTIVSGLARGIDAAAHRGALEAKGPTGAGLGCGIDRTYPPEHQALRRQIEANGAVVTEFPLGASPHGYHFPRRNRIISGMCLGAMVTEAAFESGSLITARLAADQGREVFAVPGSVKADTSRGPNGLIKQGAKLVETVEDVIEELLSQVEAPFQTRLRDYLNTRFDTQVKGSPRLGQEEASICELLSSEPTHVDDIIEKSGLPAATVSGLLLALELKGAIHQLPGHFCIRL
ncbi:MAG: DNA-processing protein DprA [Nitrospiraceae bacterium]